MSDGNNLIGWNMDHSVGAIIVERSELEWKKWKTILVRGVKNEEKVKLGGEREWSFPKGHIEGNETELETCKREILEETGLLPSQYVIIRKISSIQDLTKENRWITLYYAEMKQMNIELDPMDKNQTIESIWTTMESIINGQFKMKVQMIDLFSMLISEWK